MSLLFTEFLLKALHYDSKVPLAYAGVIATVVRYVPNLVAIQTATCTMSLFFIVPYLVWFLLYRQEIGDG